ncbi:TolC family protein [Clostridium rectalis]|uniref:TolC family protein n=1 Tax=Clostridium rectalis TaxID=2040295 RepID=UPI0013DDC1C0|nr:TolC family protein [Clostridium rectalis]
MKNIKRLSIVSMAIIIAIASSNKVFAKEEKELKLSQPKVLSLTLQEAFDKVKKDNVELKMLDEKITILNRMYDRKHAKAIEADNSGRSDVETKKTALLYASRAAEDVDNAEKDKDNRIKELKREVEKEYLNIVNCNKEVENTKKTLRNLQREIEKVNANIDQGTAVENALTPLKLQKMQLETSLNPLKAQKEESEVRLRQYLNVDENTTLNFINNKKEFIKYDDSKINLVIKEALAGNYDLKKMNKELEFAKLEVEIYEKYGRNVLDAESSQKIRVNDLENSLCNLRSNVQVNMWKVYFDLKNKEALVEIEKLNLDNSASKLKEAETKYKNGLIDELQFDLAKLSFEKQNIVFEKAVNDYMINVDGFKDLLELESIKIK